MASSAHRAKAVVDLAALQRNFREARRLAGPAVQVWPAVKANAYGHGAREAAESLIAAGADGFCVATPEEAAEIASMASGLPVLILGAFHPEDAQQIVTCGCEAAVVDTRSALQLSSVAGRAGHRVRVHLKVDTGMGRVGVVPGGAVQAAVAVSRMPGLDLAGLMTHFPTSDEPDLSVARTQIETLAGIGEQIRSALGRTLLLHAANSGALLALPEARFNAVRPGIMLYGAFPSPDAARSASLDPVMTLASRIVFLKTVPAGASVSYGRTWTAGRQSTIATVTIGYGDGLPRALSNRGYALVRGRRAPIVGRVCMDATLLDVTDIPGVALGDEAVFWGRQGDVLLHVEEAAVLAGTIPYELTCQVTARVPRVYV